jgi:predicted regulator of Ras-like GTPase activity (Roadblock/LC7/MglB family)
MTLPVSSISAAAQNFTWLMSRFARDTAGVVAVIAVSSDGLLIGASSGLQRASADRLAAITSAVLSLAQGVSDSYPLGEPDKVVIELTEGYMLVCTISAGCALGVITSAQASLGTVAYEMAVFANSTSAVLSPRLIDELKTTTGLLPP